MQLIRIPYSPIFIRRSFTVLSTKSSPESWLRERCRGRARASTGHLHTPGTAPSNDDRPVTGWHASPPLLHYWYPGTTREPANSFLPNTRQWDVYFCPGDLSHQTQGHSLFLSHPDPLQSSGCSQARLSCLLCPGSSHTAFSWELALPTLSPS